ncbi:hypothetical protein HY357_01530 [Candidatus Roizmanbacteria bacterium]|nr:hypothetical protein [Candidatus Roizmanbacteria bacterium]
MSYFKSLLKFIQAKSLLIEKRVRFVLSAFFLTLLMLISTFFLFENALIVILLVILIGYILTYFSLLEGIEQIEWFTLFFMPIALMLSFYLFYFLFPVRWLTRVPFVVLFGVSIYAILLCSNIFNVGVEKSLQLYRAAFSINFFYQAVVSFLLFNTLLSFKLIFFLNTLLVAILVFLLSYQLLWSVKLNLKFERALVLLSLFIAIVIGELTLIFSFVPIKSTIFALFLTSSYYSLSGLIFNYLDQRLFKETIREYVMVWVVVLIITILSINW